MPWQKGFTRVRITGAVALAAGLAVLISVLSSDLLGYAPNPWFVQLYGALWSLSLLLIALAALLFAMPWILRGFLPDDAAKPPR